MTTDTSDRSVAELWHALTTSVIAGDLERARSFAEPNLEWQVMGRSPQAGRYSGVEGLSELLRKVRESSDGTFHLETEMTVGDNATGVIVGRVTASRVGKTLDTRNIFLIQAECGLIARGWTIPMDQYAFDAFWD